ncbi:ABC transporter permease [Hymenobacter latericus]|uniref:ABC transporter permease n=1 Tax=Hymenobacter sp. YIM 151858-1 TaxID=2987688 RepID=UPI002225D346|nr:ABC transporter permease [Hymenobacter sp. YIM 151858-1]UYZ59079.1 ABC transporter permease [Hymenobacter sp. YIM 151858-1]
MAKLLAKRIGMALGTAWLVASVVFLLSRAVAANSPQLFVAEQLAPTASAATRAATEQQYRQRLGLQQPLFYCSLLPWRWHGGHNQYHTWLGHLSRGHLGTSYRDGTAVEEHLGAALAVTLPLTGTALLLTALLALGAAVAAARRAPMHRLLVPVAYLFDSLPLFVVALLLLVLLASPDFWPLFPSYGLESGAEPLLGSFVLDRAYHLALPMLSLVLAGFPAVFLPTAAALRQQCQQPYVTTALAKGTPVARVWWRHVLPNALPVFVSRVTELLPEVVAGAVVIELVFALPGMGRLLAEAAASRDLPVLIGGVLLVAAARVMAWVLADAMQMLLDPRTRTS